MYRRPLVPKTFAVPARLEGDGFHLRRLNASDVVKDYAAVMESAPRLVRFMDPEGGWPTGMTLDENLVDLGWHQREFMLRHSFAYTVMNDAEDRCLGCCYIYPSDNPSFEVMAYYWVREPEFHAGLDEKLGKLFRKWIAEVWPFRSVAYPGRDIPWSEW
jgi:hypothetical protein